MTNRNIPAAVLNAARAAVLRDMLTADADAYAARDAVSVRLRADADRKRDAAEDAAAYARTCDNIAARKDGTQADRDNAAAARAYARRAAELAGVLGIPGHPRLFRTSTRRHHQPHPVVHRRSQ